MASQAFERMHNTLNHHVGCLNTVCMCRRQLQVKRLSDIADIVFCSYIVFERDACSEDRAFLCAQKWQYLVCQSCCALLWNCFS